MLVDLDDLLDTRQVATLCGFLLVQRVHTLLARGQFPKPVKVYRGETRKVLMLWLRQDIEAWKKGDGGPWKTRRKYRSTE